MLGFQAYQVEIEQHLLSSSIVFACFTIYQSFYRVIWSFKKIYRYDNQLGRKIQKKSFLNHV
jgi:hypothetical protein